MSKNNKSSNKSIDVLFRYKDENPEDRAKKKVEIIYAR